jgi:hypothetical protein
MPRKTKSLSLDPALLQAAERRAASLGLGDFSEYVRQLIRRDLQAGQDFVIVAEPKADYAPEEPQVVGTAKKGKGKSPG